MEKGKSVLSFPHLQHLGRGAGGSSFLSFLSLIQGALVEVGLLGSARNQILYVNPFGHPHPLAGATSDSPSISSDDGVNNLIIKITQVTWSLPQRGRGVISHTGP